MYKLKTMARQSITLPQEVNSQGMDPDKEILPLNSEKITETEGVYFSVIRVLVQQPRLLYTTCRFHPFSLVSIFLLQHIKRNIQFRFKNSQATLFVILFQNIKEQNMCSNTVQYFKSLYKGVPITTITSVVRDLQHVIYTNTPVSPKIRTIIFKVREGKHLTTTFTNPNQNFSNGNLYFAISPMKSHIICSISGKQHLK